MQINTLAIMSSSVLLTSTFALAGGAEQVTLNLDTVQAKPGELVSIAISMETTELVGGQPVQGPRCGELLVLGSD